MASELDPAELVGSVADERLLDAEIANLPGSVGRPEGIPPSKTRGRLVGVGATLTGVTLIGGLALMLVGVIVAISGGIGVVAIVAIVLGLVLVATHWGWVHVAEATADAIEARRDSEITARRRSWLDLIEPYTRYEVTTDVGEDGSITISRVRYRPVRTGERRFTFKREIEHTEVHSGEESGAAITERAELLRRQAAADTERERLHFEAAHGAYQEALLAEGSEREQLEARRAESRALSERINTNLRDPPLTE
ncbi:MAG: hypothetical protein JOZ98_18860 [Solirubrobacterales bacterium]|nr:hypothetical protein [Solirubrobacterales bacterium]